VVLDVETGKKLWALQSTAGYARCLFSPVKQTLATGDNEDKVLLLNAADGMPIKTLTGNGKGVRGLTFSPDGTLLAVASGDQTLRVWDVEAANMHRSFAGPKARYFAAAFSPDGKHLVGTNDHGWQAWDSATGNQVQTGKGSGFIIQHVAFAANPDQFLTGDNEGMIRLWSLASGKELLALKNPGGVMGMSYDPVRGLLATCGFGENIPILGLPIRKPNGQQARRVSELLAQLDDDKYDVREKAGAEILKLGLFAEPALANASEHSSSVEVRIRARRLRSEIHSTTAGFLNGHLDQVNCVACYPAKGLLASGGKDGTIKLWDLTRQKELGCLFPPDARKAAEKGKDTGSWSPQGIQDSFRGSAGG
jgi:WD40 repeat protein